MKSSCDVDAGTTATESSIQPLLEWKFLQVFGERAAGEEVQDVDIISAIEFDKSGNHLATGDRGGRLVLFEKTDVRHHGFRKDLEKQDCPITRHLEFSYKTEFQSHEPEFDYLKSLEIEEKINKIKWCQTTNNSLFLLSTNHKTIKYWKVQEKKVKKFSETNIDISETRSIASTNITATRFVPDGASAEKPHSHLSHDFSIPPGGSSLLHFPVATSQETSLIPKCRRIYAHAHDYHINSISTNRNLSYFWLKMEDKRAWCTKLPPMLLLYECSFLVKVEDKKGKSGARNSCRAGSQGKNYYTQSYPFFCKRLFPMPNMEDDVE